VAHGTLNAHHVVLTDDGPAIADFAWSSGAASVETRAADVAELLTSTAGFVGDDRAIAAARRGVGDAAVLAALPRLQPAALSAELRPRHRAERKALGERLTALREGAAVAVGAEPPPLQQLYRVDATSLVMAVGTLIAVFALLGQVGDPGDFVDTMKSADWAWLTVALVISFSTNVATAIALMGTVPVPLPLWRTSELQLSMSFSNLAVPAVGGLAAQVRFLQRQGVELSAAAASGGLVMSVGNTAAQIVLFLVALALSPTTVSIGKIPVSTFVRLAVLAVIVAAVVAGIVYVVPRLRRMLASPVKSAASTIWGTIRSPRRLSLLLGGNALNAVLYALVMDACIAGFGASIDFFTLLAINIGVATIASLVPIPGGGTAVSSVSMTGALTAAGVPTEAAVAAVLANQLVANFIPAVPGWFATKDLLSSDYL
jgi:uncharacterized membrane protein YbhN (UPF0104 family)